MANENTGALFTVENDDRENAPYASGKLTLEGKEHYIDAWKIKENGKDQLDFQFKAKGSSRKTADGSGMMQRNEKSNDKQPDWKGTLEWNGKELPIAGWRRQSKKTGQWFLSLVVGGRSEPNTF